VYCAIVASRLRQLRPVLAADPCAQRTVTVGDWTKVRYRLCSYGLYDSQTLDGAVRGVFQPQSNTALQPRTRPNEAREDRISQSGHPMKAAAVDVRGRIQELKKTGLVTRFQLSVNETGVTG
jgi:hypothetical protein